MMILTPIGKQIEEFNRKEKKCYWLHISVIILTDFRLTLEIQIQHLPGVTSTLND